MKILLVRGSSQPVNSSFYNLQEIGLARALAKKNIKCDIVYINSEKSMKKETVYTFKDVSVDIYWVPGLRIFKDAIYVNLFLKGFFHDYDIIQSAEYNSIMTLLISLLYRNKLIVYHGPYDEGRHKKIYKLFDILFLNLIRKNTKFIFTKSILAEEYLRQKGFKNIETIGVGLDIENLRDKNNESDEVLFNKDNFKYILYAGVLEDRRNILFILEVLQIILKKKENVKLIIIGKGEEDYVKKAFDYAEALGVGNSIIHHEKTPQKEMYKYYMTADVFIFPSKMEIFGMVLLESMFYGVPTVSSYNGGACTLIEHESNGYIHKDFNKKEWASRIIEILDNENIEKLKQKSKETILAKYTWDTIADRFIEKYRFLASHNINVRKDKSN
ncbi:MAG: glycosyltransferase family 4 protein [Clostridia bacterium]|nr:glycosyltransferase family 4 protein [Clostridia bacterium]